ncbi:hypothetical protein M5D96_010296 [Drosophila gunungcola]|uniref:Uncharacterized protein n=1 Tax=Drosophila gunungcola TaxID=103775 RepID=A0A9Q0BMF3_9MUSC|nr:hypothetical protein M5D96_010296 [Drosophila gunungcola]
MEMRFYGIVRRVILLIKPAQHTSCDTTVKLITMTALQVLHLQMCNCNCLEGYPAPQPHTILQLKIGATQKTHL